VVGWKGGGSVVGGESGMLIQSEVAYSKFGSVDSSDYDAHGTVPRYRLLFFRGTPPDRQQLCSTGGEEKNNK
jgi:hypothetical protein